MQGIWMGVLTRANRPEAVMQQRFPIQAVFEGKSVDMKKLRKDFDKNVSPTGWYFGSYLQRFIELEDKQLDGPNKRFASWENSVVVKAKSISQAFDKVEKLAKKNSKPYLGGENGVKVQWEYLGVTELIPIYEEIADGAEIAWEQRTPRSLKTLKQWVKSKDEICAGS